MKQETWLVRAGNPRPSGRGEVNDLLAVSFTASRDLDTRGREVILSVLATAVPPGGRYITGGAIGGDSFIGRWLYENRPGAGHLVIVPADRSRVDPWWLAVSGPGPEVMLMPHGTTYAARDARLVEKGAMLFGFPAYPEDDPRSLRSGTWQTNRMGRRAGKLCRWDCVKPPYHGKVERWPYEFGYTGSGNAL